MEVLEMASIAQIQKAVARFIDEQVSCSLSGWDKTFVCGTGVLLTAGLPKIIAAYEKHPLVSVATAIGAYDPDNKMVDIDLLYETYSPYFSADKIPIKIPLINKTIKIGRNEIDTIIKYIKEA
jgi:hypothetical protein